jgi:hypothetical protein
MQPNKLTVIGLAAKARSGKDTGAAMLLENDGAVAYALADPLKRGCQALFCLSDEQTWSDELKEQKIPQWGMSPREMFQQVGTEWMRAENPLHWLMRADREIKDPQVPEQIVPHILELQTIPFILAVKAFYGIGDDQMFSQPLNVEDPFWKKAPIDMISMLYRKATERFPDYYERITLMQPLDINASTYITRPNLITQGKTAIIIKDIRFENEADYIRSMGGQVWHIVREGAVAVNAHASEAGIKIADEDVVIDNNGTLEDYAANLAAQWNTLSPNSQ